MLRSASRVAALVVFLAVAAFVVGTAAGADEEKEDTQPALSFVAPDATLKFASDKRKDYEAAKLALLLQNTAPTGGRLELSLVLPDATVLPAQRAADAESLPALVLLLPPEPGAAVEGRSATALRLELRRAKGAKEPAKGQLIVRLAGTPPLGPAVLAVAAAPAANKLQFAQKEATLNVTRWLGPLSRPIAKACGCDVGLNGETLLVGSRGTDLNQKGALLNSDSGGTVKLTLTRADDDSSTLTASDITDRGKYEGDLTLDPEADKPRTLKATVHVRDAIIWPLLAILLGALLGVFGIRKNELRRGRNLIQAAIKKVVDPYLRARERNARRPADRRDPERRYYLDELLPQDGSPYVGPGACGDSLREVPALYCRTYDIDSDEALTELVAAVKETTAKFDRWTRVEQAVDALKRGLGRLPDDSPMRDDATALLVRTHQPVDDDAAAAKLVAVLRAEARFATLYRHLRHRFDAQHEDWRETHERMDPDHEVAKLAANAPWTRSEDHVETVERDLLCKAELMRHPSEIPPDHEEKKLATYVLAHCGVAASQELRAMLAMRVREELELADEVAPPAPDTRSPELIRAQVRRADWFVFVVAAVVTALAYLAKEYKGDYGSLDEYVFAFAAGAVAPSAITWALLPFSRSYNALAGQLGVTWPPAAGGGGTT